MRPVLYAAYQMCDSVRAFGSAPALSSAFQQLQIRRPLLRARRRLRIPRAQRPLVVERRKQRRHAIVVRQIRIGAAREERERQVVLAVDDRDDHRGRSIARRRHVDVQAGVEERERGGGKAVARRVVQRGEPALFPDLLDVRRRPRTAAAASRPRPQHSGSFGSGAAPRPAPTPWPGAAAPGGGGSGLKFESIARPVRAEAILSRSCRACVSAAARA